MKFKTIHAILIGSVFITAHAQVYRCVDGSGKTIYSDAACEYKPKALDEAKLRANSVDGSYWRDRAVENTSQNSNNYSRQSEVSNSSGNSPNCPSDQEIKNMQTSLRSVTNSNKVKSAAIQRDIDLARTCRNGGNNYSKTDWDQIKSNQRDYNKLKPNERKIARDDSKSIHMSKASEAERQRLEEIDRREAMERQERNSRRPLTCNIPPGATTATCY
jgi:hypothetical protein